MPKPPDGRVVALVAVGADPADAPSPALLELQGIPLIEWAVRALADADEIERVVVAGPPSVAVVARDRLPAVEVVSAAGPFGDAMLAGFEHLGPAADDLVVVHDPRYPLATAGLVSAVVAALRGAPWGTAAAIPTQPVTDTLKWVDDAGAVVGTAPREAFLTVCAPHAYRAGRLAEIVIALARRLGSMTAIPAEIVRCGGRLVTVDAPVEVFEVAHADDVLLADAMLLDRPRPSPRSP